jgi:soluble lytic murein transglycosylase-like protein
LRALPIRSLAGALLLAAASFSAYAVQNDGVSKLTPAGAIVVAPPKAAAAAKIAKPAKPAGPSVFQLESAMTSSQLIARWNPVIKAAAKRYNVPEEWIRAVMRMESGGKTMLDEDTPIISTAGAMGLMQVMPDTYKILRDQYGFGADPYNVRDNIFAGTEYLKWLHGKYGSPAMFAAYNAGPGRLEQYINVGTQLPLETQRYVGGITRVLNPGQTVSFGKAKLTQPDGTPLTIDAKTITSIRAALPGEFAPSVQSVLMIGKRMQGVRETVEAAKSAIKGASLSL